MIEDEIIKKEIKKIAKKPIWASELYRQLIKNNINITWPKFLEIIKEMSGKEIRVKTYGNMKFIEVIK